jgi:hypothetical protein
MKQLIYTKLPRAGGAAKDRMDVNGVAMVASKPPLPARPKPVVSQVGKKSVFDFPEDEPRSKIQWPNEEQIGAVCSRLRQIKKIGMENEGLGDHFSSGDLAYQVQEIIRSTDDLFRKSLRVKKHAA